MADRKHDIPEIRNIPVDSIRPNPWNPNTMTDMESEILGDNFNSVGFVQPIMVRPVKTKKGERYYQIVDGEHRFRQARREGWTSIPAVVVELNRDQARKQTVRMNKIRGKFDTRKLAGLIDTMIIEGCITEDNASFELGFADANEFALIRESARETLPTEEAKQEFDKKVKQAKSIDDIYELVALLIKKYGNTLQSNFMMLCVGESRHLWVKLENDLIDQFEEIGNECLRRGVTFSSLIVSALQNIENIDVFIEEHRDSLSETVEGASEFIGDYYHDSEKELKDLR